MRNAKTTIRRSFVIAATGAALLLSVLAVPTQSLRGGAEEWVASLSATDRLLFVQPESLGGLPVEYRRALARALTSPDERMAFWRATFAAFRESRVLSPEQATAIDAAEALIPEAFGPDADKESVVPKLALARASLVELLGKDDADWLLRAGQVRDAGSSGLPLPERLRYLWRRHRPDRLAAALNYLVPVVMARLDDCTCGGPSMEDHDCTYYQSCGQPQGQECEMYSPPYCGLGCGDWGCWGCWGICFYPV